MPSSALFPSPCRCTRVDKSKVIRRFSYFVFVYSFFATQYKCNSVVFQLLQMDLNRETLTWRDVNI